MQLTQKDIEELRGLEESFWRSETRYDLAHQERFFAPDCFEFGRSGRVYSRAEMIRTEAQDIRAKLPLQSFQVRSLDQSTVQVTYISEAQYEELEKANRTSIWSKTEDGWQMRFHQGTAIR